VGPRVISVGISGQPPGEEFPVPIEKKDVWAKGLKTSRLSCTCREQKKLFICRPVLIMFPIVTMLSWITASTYTIHK
jgi:hypothetical protein